MRTPTLLALFAIATPALAQNYYVPDNDATMGTANVIPFGSAGPGSFSNCHMQVRATAAELGGVANLITGLGFACSSTGSAHYDTIEIVMDQIPATQALSTTFASNLTPNAVTVLSATDYTWNISMNTWTEVGLQTYFVFNGIDDVVIDITTTGATAPGGMRRGTNQRIFSTTLGALSGSSSNSATKFEVSMLTGRTSTYGVGCAGSNGTPQHRIVGTGQTSTTVSLDLTNGVPSGLALLIAGTTSTAPYPLELSMLNMPGCFAYTDLLLSTAVQLDAAGSSSLPVVLPPGGVGFLLYTQYACVDLAANAFGLTTSNYGRTFIGL